MSAHAHRSRAVRSSTSTSINDRFRSVAIVAVLFLWFGTTAAVCDTPSPPACHVSGRCPAGFVVVCDQCVAVSARGGACVADLCVTAQSPATAPRCDPAQALVCVGGTCQPGAPLGHDCATATCDEQFFCLHLPPPRLGEPQACIDARANTRDLAGLTGQSLPANACEPFQLTEGAVCESDATAPHCAPCAPGLACLGGACHRPCDPTQNVSSADLHNGDCPCAGSVCPSPTAGQPAVCVACAELGAACTPGSACCDVAGQAAQSCTEFARCCRASGACAQAADCCGTSGTNGACFATASDQPRTCGVCSAVGAPCSSVDQCCRDAARCDAPGGAGTVGLCCPTGTGHCDARSATCETNLLTDAHNCGACGNVCPAVAGAIPYCQNGTCHGSCIAGEGDCNHNPADGCETNVLTDTNNCGACGHRCAVGGTGATVLCNHGLCTEACSAPMSLCDGYCIDTRTDTTNCGACGHACTGGRSCAGGVCALACSPAGMGCALGLPACCAGLSCNTMFSSLCVAALPPCAVCAQGQLCAPNTMQPAPYPCLVAQHGSGLTQCNAANGTPVCPGDGDLDAGGDVGGDADPGDGATDSGTIHGPEAGDFDRGASGDAGA